jgi:dTDP-4-amino-4,6-dideoxygalactose transaminase
MTATPTPDDGPDGLPDGAHGQDAAQGGPVGPQGVPDDILDDGPAPPPSPHNAHLFFLVCRSLDERTQLIAHLKANGVASVFHYLSLHKSPYFAGKHDGRELKNADRFTDSLLRLPMYAELDLATVNKICDLILSFYAQ